MTAYSPANPQPGDHRTVVVDKLLRRVTYKPGWTFEVGPEVGPAGSTYFGINFDTVDTYNNNAPRRIAFGGIIPGDVIEAAAAGDPARFYSYLLHVIADLEAHEAAEWFRVSGVMVADPHAETRDGLRGIVNPDAVDAALDQPPPATMTTATEAAAREAFDRINATAAPA